MRIPSIKPHLVSLVVCVLPACMTGAPASSCSSTLQSTTMRDVDHFGEPGTS